MIAVAVIETVVEIAISVGTVVKFPPATSRNRIPVAPRTVEVSSLLECCSCYWRNRTPVVEVTVVISTVVVVVVVAVVVIVVVVVVVDRWTDSGRWRRRSDREMPSQLSKFGDNDDDGDDELSRVVVKPVVIVAVYLSVLLEIEMMLVRGRGNKEGENREGRGS
uniref:Transmembrane protein n=1 Tax=Wuchereria bancrofti TaxID=6293 RepID=A0A1I8ERY5_WUCBA